jgi:hypothetical protein
MSILELHVQVDIVQTIVQDEILGQITQRIVINQDGLVAMTWAIMQVRMLVLE